MPVSSPPGPCWLVCLCLSTSIESISLIPTRVAQHDWHSSFWRLSFFSWHTPFSIFWNLQTAEGRHVFFQNNLCKIFKGRRQNMYLFQFWENVILFSIGLFKICSPNLCPPYLMFLSKQITGIISESHSTSPAWIYSLAYENFPTWGMNCMPSGSKTRALQCQAVLGKTSCIQIALKPS